VAVRTKHYRQYRRQPAAARIAAAIRRHPVRLAAIGALSLGLAWAVITKSLPYALAKAHPDLALRLNPRNPEALIAKARELRLRLMDETPVPFAAPERGEDRSVARPQDAGESTDTNGLNSRAAALSLRIRELARQAIASGPLNPEAYRLFAETVQDLNHRRALMKEALRRSRREPAALLWLMSDAANKREYDAALGYAGLMLQSYPESGKYLIKYIWVITSDPHGLDAVSRSLANKPGWRKQVFEDIPYQMIGTSIPLALMAALKRQDAPPSPSELRPYLDRLVGEDRLDYAFNVWLQFLPPVEAGDLKLLTNGNFERVPSGSPFDWRIAPGVNATADLSPRSGGRQGAFKVTFGTGRVRFPELSQILLLPPGRYRFEGKLSGRLLGERGLRWQLSCASGTRRFIAETEMLFDGSPQWDVFGLEAEIPHLKECKGQLLRLYHDARSASEEFISGEISFSGLQIHGVPETAAVSQ
jgi:hypothetical protein